MLHHLIRRHHLSLLQRPTPLPPHPPHSFPMSNSNSNFNLNSNLNFMFRRHVSSGDILFAMACDKSHGSSNRHANPQTSHCQHPHPDAHAPHHALPHPPSADHRDPPKDKNNKENPSQNSMRLSMPPDKHRRIAGNGDCDGREKQNHRHAQNNRRKIGHLARKQQQQQQQQPPLSRPEERRKGGKVFLVGLLISGFDLGLGF